MRSWLESLGSLSVARISPASEDASFRRYFRVEAETASFIVMDAPPTHEDCDPFVRIAGYLESMQLNAPRVVAADTARGFLLLSDLGSKHYLETLNAEPAAADRLYAPAMRALATMRVEGAAFQSRLPPYDEALLRSELSLFSEWLCARYLEIEFSPKVRTHWQELCDLLIGSALEQPRVFVHRDYHSRNLMNTATNRPGILDFQDAVEGPLTYDLVSLLRDCYICWPEERVTEWMAAFYEDLEGPLRECVSRRQFCRWFDLMGVQRHLKAAGIFARLHLRDHKTGYMIDIPRTLAYIVALAPGYPELEWLAHLIETQVLGRLEDRS